MIYYLGVLTLRIVNVLVKKVKEVMITLFGNTHPVKSLFLFDTLYHITRCLSYLKDIYIYIYIYIDR